MTPADGAGQAASPRGPDGRARGAGPGEPGPEVATWLSQGRWEGGGELGSDRRVQSPVLWPSGFLQLLFLLEPLPLPSELDKPAEPPPRSAAFPGREQAWGGKGRQLQGLVGQPGPASKSLMALVFFSRAIQSGGGRRARWGAAWGGDKVAR